MSRPRGSVIGMFASSIRSGVRVVLAALLTVLAFVLVAPLATPAAGAAPTPLRTETEEVADYQINDLVTDLGDDGVAVVGSSANVAELTKIAADAHNQGIKLSIVVLGKNLIQVDSTQIAELVRARVGGTTLVLTPTSGGFNSDEVSISKQNEAAKAAGKYLTNPVEAARQFAAVLTKKGFPWILVLIGLVVVGIGVAVFLGFRKRRASEVADEQQLASLTQSLHERVSKLASLVLANSSRVDLAQRPDLTEKATRAGAEYNRLREKLSAPLKSRDEVNQYGSEVSTLEKQVTDLDGELDALLPGLEPPIN